MICGKTIYKSRTDANTALKGANRSRGGKDRLSVSYFCKDCSGWHIASKLRKFSSPKRFKEVETKKEIHKKAIEHSRSMKTLTIKNYSSQPIKGELKWRG